MSTRKISVVCTVYNEENTLEDLLDSLASQNLRPNEFVFVDGGSTDKTVEILKKYRKKLKNLKIYIKKGTIAQGRNESIARAKGQIIAQLDAGCTAHKNWLKEITKPFKDRNVEFVAGFYYMTGDSSLQQAAAPFLGVVPQKYDKNKFLPSARSMAFTKDFWKKVGGYSEDFTKAGEDTYFNYAAIKQNIKIERVKTAVVDWEVPATFPEIYKKFFNYAFGDAQAGILWNEVQGTGTHIVKILSIFLRYAILIVLIVFALKFSELTLLPFIYAFFYAMFPIYKMRGIITKWHVIALLPILQIVSDFAVMSGFTAGLQERKKWVIKKKQ